MTSRSRILSSVSSTSRSDVAASRAKAMFRSRSRSPSPLQLQRQPRSDPPHVASLFPGIEASESFERMSAAADKLRLETARASSVSKSRLPPENRFLPQLEPVNTSNSTDGTRSFYEELPPEEGVKQFQPALDASFEEAATSWEALVNNKTEFAEEKKVEPARNVQMDRRKARNTAVCRSNNHDDGILEDSWKSLESKKGGGRIARLASMFSSRATVRPEKRRAASPLGARTPASPAHSASTSTSGYVGWPGTQDKRGATVTVQSSYEESSTGAPEKQAVQREVSRWTGSNRMDVETNRPSPASVVSRDFRELAAPTRLGSRRHKPDDLYRMKSSIKPKAPPSPPSATTSESKTSSAYFNDEELAQLVCPSMDQEDSMEMEGRPPTEEALAESNELRTPHRSFAAAKGYRGLLEKTKEVPSLMDNMDSDSMSSSKATSTYSSVAGARRAHKVSSDNDSDVFDGISVNQSEVFDNLSNMEYPLVRTRSAKMARVSYPESIAEEEEAIYGTIQDADNDGGFGVVMLANGLTAIKPSDFEFTNRQTASDFDENLTNSEVDQQGFARVPGLNEMINAGRYHDSSLRGIRGNFGSQPRVVERCDVVSPGEDLTISSGNESSLFSDPYDHEIDGSHLDVTGDLSEYYVHPKTMKHVVRRYRELSEKMENAMDLSEYEREEDEHKAFALFEMRSRIMEKDIDRGLERRGGTAVVDDIVTTEYYKTWYRVRDAVLVAKAWRDGASPKDVINTALLTRRAQRSHFIRRPLPISVNDSMNSFHSRRYTWEAVKWIDDTDFMQYRCPSLGPRSMRGFEMFTVGDCQSILLKLTHEHCMKLRRELNNATRRQIEAEELLRHETDSSLSMMTASEMSYLGAMEQVKTISKKLVAAEKSFTLVRDRIEELVARYQELLVRIEDDESFAEAASSIVTYESSYFSQSEHDSKYWEEQEKELWARRAQRAEVKAELAAREALLAKQQVRVIKEEKEKELEALQRKLSELQSESSTAVESRRRSAAIAQSYVPDRAAGASGRGVDQQKVDGVKQRFRERVAARKTAMHQPLGSATRPLFQPAPRVVSPTQSPSQQARMFIRSAGEEMYQHLDFYARSLRAVATSRD